MVWLPSVSYGRGDCSWLGDSRAKMSIKSDRWIREQAVDHGMIAPFSEKQVKDGVISYGLSSATATTCECRTNSRFLPM